MDSALTFAWSGGEIWSRVVDRAGRGDHAAAFPLGLSGRSTSTPFSNLAPAVQAPAEAVSARATFAVTPSRAAPLWFTVEGFSTLYPYKTDIPTEHRLAIKAF